MTTPADTQRIIPYLFYEDAPAAITFLERAFGFQERRRFPMGDGRIGHAEVARDGNILMLASIYEGFGTSPLHLPDVNAQIYCYVTGVDAHFDRAREGYATIVASPSNQHGTRMYRAMDPEGHRFIFAEQLEHE